MGIVTVPSIKSRKDFYMVHLHEKKEYSPEDIEFVEDQNKKMSPICICQEIAHSEKFYENRFIKGIVKKGRYFYADSTVTRRGTSFFCKFQNGKKNSDD